MEKKKKSPRSCKWCLNNGFAMTSKQTQLIREAGITLQVLTHLLNRERTSRASGVDRRSHADGLKASSRRIVIFLYVGKSKMCEEVTGRLAENRC